MQQQDSSSPVDEQQEAEIDDDTQFEKSVKDLRDLCSHLHQAANCCETSFLNARHKRTVVDNTKEYTCRALVTVVDHLGSISDKLECRLMKTKTLSETELRIDSLKQRLGTWQYYSHLLALRTNSWDADFPRHHPRYISPPITDPQRTNSIRSPVTSKAARLEIEEEVPLFLYSTFDHSLQRRRRSISAPVLPVRDGMSILPLKDEQHPKFHFLESRKLKRGMLNWKLAQSKDLRSLIRRGKRTLTS